MSLAWDLLKFLPHEAHHMAIQAMGLWFFPPVFLSVVCTAIYGILSVHYWRRILPPVRMSGPPHIDTAKRRNSDEQAKYIAVSILVLAIFTVWLVVACPEVRPTYAFADTLILPFGAAWFFWKRKRHVAVGWIVVGVAIVAAGVLGRYAPPLTNSMGALAFFCYFPLFSLWMEYSFVMFRWIAIQKIRHRATEANGEIR
jgi:hypothetical protein